MSPSRQRKVYFIYATRRCL